MIIKSPNDFKLFSIHVNNVISENINKIGSSGLKTLYNDLVQKTPKDTEHASENYHFTVAAPATKELSIDDKTATQESIAFIDSNPFFKYKKFYLTNTASSTSKKSGKKFYYLWALENGHSKQAPNGVVKISVLNMINKVENL
jgi:hypothetical protein